MTARRPTALDPSEILWGARDLSEVDDHDTAMLVFISTIGLRGRTVYIHGYFQPRLLGVRVLSPLGLFASANLLDDERG